MPLKSMEKRREYKHNYYLEHKEELLRRNKIWQQTHPEVMRSYAQKRQRKLRLGALEHYSEGGVKCRCCGEEHLEFLAIDHVGGGGNQQRKEVGRLCLYQWLKNNGYPDGYRVLCHNCNQSLGAYGYCPHGGLDEG